MKPHFADHRQVLGAEHVGEQVHRVQLQLGFLEAVPAFGQGDALTDHRLLQLRQRAHAAEGAVEQVGTVELYRLVGRVAQFTGQRPTLDRRGEADAVQAYIFRVFPAWPDAAQCAAGRCVGKLLRHRWRVVADRQVRCARVVVHVVNAHLAIQRIDRDAQSQAPLTAVFGVLAFVQRQVGTGVDRLGRGQRIRVA
ncbi:hypothetical protein D3C81_1325960 [compost metagenome]